MKQLQFEFETRLEFSSDITDHSFTLRCLPVSDGRQFIAEPKCFILPDTGSVWRSRDSFGNTLICGRAEAPHSQFSFRVTGTARTENSSSYTGTAQPFYRAHSPLAQPGDVISAFYNEHRPSGDIISRAEQLAESVYNAVEYRKNSTNVDTTAEEALSQGCGVCQDMAHILLALLRMEGIPCRYAAGLAFECGETHAWTEFCDGERWIGMDPTHNKYTDSGYIKLCHGRDYSDCPIERGIYLGNTGSIQTVSSRITEY